MEEMKRPKHWPVDFNLKSKGNVKDIFCENANTAIGILEVAEANTNNLWKLLVINTCIKIITILQNKFCKP